MPLRLMEIFLPEIDDSTIKELFENETTLDYWQEETSSGSVLIKLLISADKTEKILDRLEEKYGNREGFRVFLLHVEATIPRVEEIEDITNSNGTETAQNPEDEKDHQERISREELYADIVDSVKLSKNYLTLVVISSIIAAVGLMQNSVAIIIGAMVIAPLLGPNVGLALATTLADFDLGKAALRTGLAGLTISLGLSILAGLIFSIDPTIHEIATRTNVLPTDILVALASGSAGVLAFTSGVATALIGVMVSVALLPPLVVFGMLLGAGHMPEALGALLLVGTNIICLNLAGVTTLFLKGIRPRSWWEADRAGRASRFAIGLWSVLLVLLVFIVYLSQR
ncbi:MAG: TIGR00341 family protein [Anaerolineales bacterium]|jgi:uncharacterized hydrophobic protein (TIGR00341 family)